jgi:hypothetical protein
MKLVKNNIQSAQNTTIKSIQLACILPGPDRDQSAIYLVWCENDTKKDICYYLTSSELRDALSGEEWIRGGMNSLPYDGSNILTLLRLGSRKKENIEIKINNHVKVHNHGDYWIPHAKVTKINVDSGVVTVRWYSSGSESKVLLSNIEHIHNNTFSSRMRRYPDYFANSDIYNGLRKK